MNIWKVLIPLVGLALIGCSSPPPKKQVETVQTVEEMARELAGKISDPLKKIQDQRLTVVVFPLLGEGGKPSHLGRQIATPLVEEIAFQTNHRVLQKHWEEVATTSYLHRKHYLVDYIIVGSITSASPMVFELNLLKVPSMEKVITAREKLDQTPHRLKINRLFLSTPPVAGYGDDEGLAYLPVRTFRELKAMSGIYRIYVAEDKSKSLSAKVLKGIYEYLSDPGRFGRRAQRFSGESPPPVQPGGGEVIIRAEQMPYPQKRILVKVTLEHRQKKSTKTLSILFYQ